MGFELAQPSTPHELEEYYRLRYEILRKPLGLPPGSERDNPMEPASFHVIAKVEGRIAAAGCWYLGLRIEPDGTRVRYVRVRQVAVDPEFEGQGIGHAITNHMEQSARSLGASELVTNARRPVVAFYQRHGWIVIGEGVRLYDQVESVSMYKPLR